MRWIADFRFSERLKRLGILTPEISNSPYVQNCESTIAAPIFFAFPLIALNQQVITGLAVAPQSWEIYSNYPCIAVGAGLLSGNFFSTLEHRRGWRQLVPLGILAIIGFLVIQGAQRNEIIWLRDNVRSVLFRDVLARASAEAGPFESVVLPHLFDESLFLTRVPLKTQVIGGFNAMMLDPVPAWRDDESFAEHAAASSRSFSTGFEVLFRSGVTPEQLQQRMLGELATEDCWQGLAYFFWLGDCWPVNSNYTSSATRRLPSAVPEIVSMYKNYIQITALDDLTKRNVLVIRNEPSAAFFDDRVENKLVAIAEVSVDGEIRRAYGYLQRPKP